MDIEALAQLIILAIIVGAALLRKAFSRQTNARADTTKWEETLQNLLQGGDLQETSSPTPPHPKPHTQSQLLQPPLLPQQPTNQQPPLAKPVRDAHTTPARTVRPKVVQPFTPRAVGITAPTETSDIYTIDVAEQQAAYQTNHTLPTLPDAPPANASSTSVLAIPAEKTPVPTFVSPFARLTDLPPLQMAFLHSLIFSPRYAFWRRKLRFQSRSFTHSAGANTGYTDKR